MNSIHLEWTAKGFSRIWLLVETKGAISFAAKGEEECYRRRFRNYEARVCRIIEMLPEGGIAYALVNTGKHSDGY